MSSGVRKSRLKQTLPFHAFLQRNKILSLFKDLWRSSRDVVDTDLRSSIRNQISNEFRFNREKRDPVAIKTLMLEGLRNLEKLRAMGGGDIKQQDVDATATSKSGYLGAGWPWMRKNSK